MKSVGVLIIVVLSICGSGYAERTVWYVHPDSTLNTIQAGLDACADNDIVLVGPGTYYENIVWPNTQGIHLVSELGTEATIIDGGSAGTVISISTGVDTTTTIHGFTIQNGWINSGGGGGFLCDNSSPTIIGNDIAGNSAQHCYGGGVFCENYSSPTIIGNDITGNSANNGYGGGISCKNYSSPTIIGNYIVDNGASEGSGGGIYSTSNSSPIITGNTIANNEARFGGGINCTNASPTIADNIITGNAGVGYNSGAGGGIRCESSAAMINGNTIAHNTTGGYTGGGGGGISVDGSSPVIINNCITDNTAAYGWVRRGGGIECSGSSPTLKHNTIMNNTAVGGGMAYGGGGIAFWGCTATTDSCIIANNYPDGVLCENGSGLDIHYCDIFDNIGYGVTNADTVAMVNADYNWWGDASGPYHPTANPGGLGDSVSDYVDFDPWLAVPVGVEEQPIVKPVEKHKNLTATIFLGPLRLPEGKICKVHDITGRVVEPATITRGVYFIEVDGMVIQKVVKVR